MVILVLAGLLTGAGRAPKPPAPAQEEGWFPFTLAERMDPDAPASIGKLVLYPPLRANMNSSQSVLVVATEPVASADKRSSACRGTGRLFVRPRPFNTFANPRYAITLEDWALWTCAHMFLA